jgi:putative flippase GtrA
MAFSAAASSDRSPLRRIVPFIRWGLAQQSVRFLLVGGLNTLFGYALFTVFYLITHARQPSLVIATLISILFNFVTTGRLVFANRGLKRLLPFAAVYAVILGLNMALLEILARSGVPTLLAQAVSLPVTVVAGYVLNRYLVFRRGGDVRAP